MKKIVGIYIIKNIVNNKVYIGCSINLKTRLQRHKYLLDIGNHPNKHLQLSWIKHGKDSFIFELIEECHKFCLYKREDYYVKLFDSLNPKFGYNKLPTSENKRPNHLTQEIKDKIGKGNTGKKNKFKGKNNPSVSGDKNGNFGKPKKSLSDFNKKRLKLGYKHGKIGVSLTQEHIEIIRNRNKGNKYREIKITCLSPENVIHEFNSIKECASFLKVSSTCIHNFFYGKLNHIKGWKNFQKIYHQQRNQDN